MTFLYNGEEIVVKHFPGGSDYLVVSFMFGGRTTFAEKEFFLQKIQRKIDIDLVGISTKVGKWYISHEMDDVINIIKNFSNKKIICIGVSMGGFAALKYGKAFGAFSVLSFSPQWSINPNDLIDNPNEGERERFSKNFSDNMSDMAIKNENISERTCIVYDPAENYDKYHVEKIIQNTDKIDIIKSFYTGHHVVESLSGSINMKNILNCMSDYNYTNIRKLITQIRRKHPENIKRKIYSCIDKKPVESILCITSKSLYNIKHKEKIFSDFRFLGKMIYKTSSSKVDLSKNIIEAILKNNFSTEIKLKPTINSDEYLLINSCGGILTYDPLEKKFQIEYNFIFPNKFPVFFSSNVLGGSVYFRFFGKKMFIYTNNNSISHTDSYLANNYVRLCPSFFERNGKINSFTLKTEHGYISCDPESGIVTNKSSRDDLWENFSIFRNFLSFEIE